MKPIPKSYWSVAGDMAGIAGNVFTLQEVHDICRRCVTEYPPASHFWHGRDLVKNRKWFGGAGNWHELAPRFREGVKGVIPHGMLDDASALVIDRMETRAGISTHHAEAGDEPDVSLYLAGEPECMLAHRWQAEKPVVTLHAQLGYSHDVKTPAIQAHGLAVASSILALEAVGYAVELILWELSDAYGGRKRVGKVGKWLRAAGWQKGAFGVGILAKEANQTVTADELAFWMADPGFFRGAVLCIMGNGNGEAAREAGMTATGYPMHDRKQLAELARIYAERNGRTSRGLWLPAVQERVSQFPTAEEAAKRTAAVLRGLGFSVGG